MDRATAQEIAARIRNAAAQCDSSLRTVMRNDRLGQVKVYGSLVGDFMGHSYTNILRPIWKRFPELEPPEMREPYVEPVATLTPDSERALHEFLVNAHAALDYVRSNVSAEEAENLFAFGGLVDVANAVSAIEAFLRHPKFHDAATGKESA